MQVEEIMSFEKCKSDFNEKMLKLNQQIEMNQKKIDLIDEESFETQIKNENIFNDDEVKKVKKSKELGGNSSKMVRLLFFLILFVELFF